MSGSDGLPELDDVAKLRPLTEESVVELIQRRYQSVPIDKQYEKIHTRAGSVIVAINPLTFDVKGDLYTSAVRQKYHAEASRDTTKDGAHFERLPVRLSAKGVYRLALAFCKCADRLAVPTPRSLVRSRTFTRLWPEHSSASGVTMCAKRS